MGNTSKQIKTTQVNVQGSECALPIVTEIAKNSQWFEFTPLPDDQYEIRVRAENEGMLMRAYHAALKEEHERDMARLLKPENATELRRLAREVGVPVSALRNLYKDKVCKTNKN